MGKSVDFKDARSMFGMLSAEFKSPASGMKALVYSPAANFDDGRILLYLHGSGGFGTGLAGLYNFSDLPGLLRDGMTLTSTVIIPSCHVGDHWQPEILSAFLDDFERSQGLASIEYDVMGYSRGGTGAYYFAASAPKRVRTIVAISARSAPDVISKIAAIPILLYHGTKDLRVAADESRDMHQSLLAAGGASKLMLIDGDHFIGAHVLSDNSIFDWQRSHCAIAN
jgi:predicted esterase